MADNIHVLPGGSTDADRMKLLQQIRDNMAFHLEYATITAEIVRKRFTVLVANGFTEAQALELCWRPLS